MRDIRTKIREIFTLSLELTLDESHRGEAEASTGWAALLTKFVPFLARDSTSADAGCVFRQIDTDGSGAISVHPMYEDWCR